MELSHSLLYSSLYAHSNIRRLHLKLDSLSRQAALRVFSEIQLVPLRVFPTFFPPPRHRVHSTRKIYSTRERERKKKKASKQLAVVHAELFKWAAPGWRKKFGEISRKTGKEPRAYWVTRILKSETL